ncbi:MAG: hypothetical protein M1827_001527 [Pycnora praestabilis]|nr:MAG: hypothetical protein M1827_001527 [Pycnora praestabilis]
MHRSSQAFPPKDNRRTSYLHSSIGGYGNYRPDSPSIPPAPPRPIINRGMTSNTMYASGRAGAGNVHHECERPQLPPPNSFEAFLDHENARERARPPLSSSSFFAPDFTKKTRRRRSISGDDAPLPQYHYGIGGAGNKAVVPHEGKLSSSIYAVRLQPQPRPPSPAQPQRQHSQQQIHHQPQSSFGSWSTDSDHPLKEAYKHRGNVNPGPPISGADQLLAKIRKGLGLRRKVDAVEKGREMVVLQGPYDLGVENGGKEPQ